ncbi:MAG: AI-2E family transporter [Terriglobia bacterium]
MVRPDTTTPARSPLIGFAIAVAVLYFARDLLQPFAFALLLAFLLSPAVKRLEGWRIHRIPAALLVFVFTSAVFVVVGWMVANQLIQIVESLPQYQSNVSARIEVVKGKSKGFSDLIASLENMGTLTSAAPVRKDKEPLPVVVVEQSNIVETVRGYASELLKPLGTIALIMVFTIFMLIDREGLRNRLLRLMGQQKLQATTKAMDDAGQRVSRYVLLQFAVNAAFGFIIAAGLFFLNVPYFFLWGVLGIFLRFLPYIGPVIAALLPFALTLAVTDGWRTPFSVLGLFFVTEAIIGNFVEPLLYGVHTGLSAVAILVSAVFWTVLWGPVGLVLSTPLTVCLSVLGRHSPQLEFLNIVLGDEPVLTSEVIFYQRLLALDQQDALNVLDGLAKDQPLITIFDTIVLPALAIAERDRHTGQLDARRQEFIVQSINEFVTELAEAETLAPSEIAPRKTRVFCIPAHDAADEIAAAMCAHFLNQEKFPAIAFPVTESPGQLMKTLAVQPDDIVCISAVPPFAAGNARKVARDIRENGSNPLIIAALWTYNSSSEARLERLRKSLSLLVATSLSEVVAQVREIDQPTVTSPPF